jgi:hypothetical protein
VRMHARALGLGNHAWSATMHCPPSPPATLIRSGRSAVVQSGIVNQAIMFFVKHGVTSRCCTAGVCQAAVLVVGGGAAGLAAAFFAAEAGATVSTLSPKGSCAESLLLGRPLGNPGPRDSSIQRCTENNRRFSGQLARAQCLIVFSPFAPIVTHHQLIVTAKLVVLWQSKSSVEPHAGLKFLFEHDGGHYFESRNCEVVMSEDKNFWDSFGLCF